MFNKKFVFHKKIMFHKLMAVLLIAALVLTQFVTTAAAQLANDPYDAIDFTKVKITDDFWMDYQKMFILNGIPSGIARVNESSAGMPNIRNMARKNRGESYGSFSGALYVDSDVHKVLEAMCYALQLDPQGDSAVAAGQQYIRDTLDEWIPYYQDAQMPDGYFDTYYTLDGGGGATNRWTTWNNHELYIAGHFYEAAVAHYRATGGQDTRLFDMAIKNADYIESLFGPGKWLQAPGHEEIELALVKLAGLCGEIGVKNGVDYTVKANKYLTLAKFFIDARGHDWNDRKMAGNQGSQCQDNMPVQQLTSAVGHSVRAAYLYTGMADVSIALNTDEYINALLALAEDVEEAKTYVHGGVGVDGHGEGYGARFELPNNGSYSETCANIANVMWNKRLNMLFGDSKYADVIERGLYNGVISGINMAGDRFFYQNMLISTGGVARFAWTGTACCPTNLMRTVMSIGQYVYTQRNDVITTNLYIGNEGSFDISGKDLKLITESKLPWEGEVSTTVVLSAPLEFSIRLRVPDWAKWDNSFKVNGQQVSPVPDAQGYVVISRVWSNGDKIEINLPMEPTRFYSHPSVTTNAGLVAIKRGPIVYAAESIDNDYPLNQYILTPEGNFSTEWKRNLNGDSSDYFFKDVLAVKAEAIVNAKGGETPAILTLIPYYAWNNRGALPMNVYISEVPQQHPVEWYARPSASYTYSGDSPNNLNDGDFSSGSRWTAYNGTMNHPADEWVRYDFDEPVTIWGTNICWYDDAGGVQIPQGMKISYWNGKEWLYVNPIGDGGYNAATGVYNTFTGNTVSQTRFNYYRFTPVFTTAIRLEMTSGPNANTMRAPGIKQWQIAGSMYEYPWERFAYPTASHTAVYGDSPFGMNDGVIDDPSTNARRWTSYGQSQTPWVQYDFAQPILANACDVDWFIAPDLLCNLPNGLEIQYWDGSAFRNVTPIEPFTEFVGSKFNRYEFEPVWTTRLRMNIDNRLNSGQTFMTYPGIREWRVIGAPPEQYPLEFFAVPNASHTSSYNRIWGLNDGITEPESANVYKWTSYGMSNNPSVWYTFDTPVVIDSCDIDWSDDGGGVQTPRAMEIQYWDGTEYVPVTPTNAHDTFNRNVFNKYTFEPVETTMIRLNLSGKGSATNNGCVGIREWKVSGHKSLPVISSDLTYGIEYDKFNVANFAPVTTTKIRMLTNSATPVGLVQLRVKTDDNEYVEKDASVTASFTCLPYSTLDAVNDGLWGSLSAETRSGWTWSTWANNTSNPSQGLGEHWVEYAYEEPLTFVSMEAFWYRAWDDGVIRPDRWKAQYFEGGEWKDVESIYSIGDFDSSVYDYLIRIDAGMDLPKVNLSSEYDFVDIRPYQTLSAPGVSTVTVKPAFNYDIYAPEQIYRFKLVYNEIYVMAHESDRSIIAELGNYSGANKSGVLILAFYDKEKRLVSIKTEAFENFADGEALVISELIPLGYSDMSYQVFAWDQSYVPLCVSYSAAVN